MKVNKISFELFSYATEDIEEVKKCLLHILPPELHKNLEEKLQIKILEGHFKEPITLIKLNIKSRQAEDVFNYIITHLNKKFTKNEFLKRFDESNGFFHLRLNKQLLHDSDLKINILDRGDIIKLKIHFQGYPLKTNNLLNYLQENDYINE